MRELKFRAWTGQRLEAVAIDQDGEPMSFDAFEYYPARDWIIEQYTGLHDKNGKEIYEGDILRGGMLDEACCVEWQDNTGQYVAWGEHYNVYGHRFDQFEVIGNIHENPELIK